MKLYSGPLSLFTGKVRVALDEKELAYELVSVPFTREGYQPKHPDVLALNPKAQVPVLVDGPLSLYDSTLIFEYLEDRYPEPPLYPHDAVERARCRQLEAASDEILFPPIFELITEVFYKPDGTGRDEARVTRARDAIARQYDGLEQRIVPGAFLCGAFGVADIAYFLTISFAGNFGVAPNAGHPALQAWYQRVAERPSIAREMAGLAGAMASLTAR